MKEQITQTELKKLLTYNPSTGEFSWNVKLSPTGKIGTKAGCYKVNEGYIQIQIHNKKYRAHRLAWFYMTGQWPKKYIDHINRDRQDNRFENLREADDSLNQANRRISKNNTSGFKGVFWSKRNEMWTARIKHHGISYHLGYYIDKNLAAKVYARAAKKLFGDYAYTGPEEAISY